MGRYALVKAGKVVNLIVWDGEQFDEESGEGWKPPPGTTPVLIPDESIVGIGDTHNGKKFIPAPPPADDEET